MELAEQNVCKCDTQMLDDSQNDSRSNEFSESMTSHHRHRHWLATLARMTNVEHSLFFDSQIRLDAYLRRLTLFLLRATHNVVGASDDVVLILWDL